MDISGCPPGWFTDRILVYQPEIICSDPVAGWIVVNVVLLLLRVALICNQKPNRFSRGVMATYALIIAHVCLFVFTAANLANTTNSVSGVLFALYLFSMSMSHAVFVRGMIALGSNIIPLSRQFRDAFEENTIFSDLRLEDSIIRFLGLLSWAISGALLVIFIIGATAFPSQFWPFEVGIALVPCYQSVTASMILWQIQRCKNAMHRIMNGSMKVENDTIRNSVNRAHRTMTNQQIIIGLCTVPTLVFCVLFAIRGVLPMTWWLFALSFLMSDTLMVFLLNARKLSCLRRRAPQENSHSTASSKNALAIVAPGA